jgi:hypothetical protein
MPIDQRIINIIERLLNGELRLREEVLKRETGEIKGRMAMRGMVGSSVTVQLVTELICREYRTRGQLAWDHFQRVILKTGIILRERELPELCRWMEEFLEAQFRILADYLYQTLNMITVDRSIRPLQDELAALKEEYRAKVELLEVSRQSNVNETLIKETLNYLEGYPDALKLYQEAITKFQDGAYKRNLLDDLRLALELLLKGIFKNEKSLENQISILGTHLKKKGGSKELTNMFVTLVDYYAHYHNTYVKHDDAVIEEEIEFIFEITSSFVKHIMRLS